MYTLDASGQTGSGNQLDPIWPAESSGTRLRIQNQSQQSLTVLVTKTDNTILKIVLPNCGDFVDETWVDPTLAVGVQSAFQNASFAAVRMA